MIQQAADRTQWSLVGTVPTATSCHKPSTVSGGGKSEISKAITDAFIFGNAYVPDFDRDWTRSPPSSTTTSPTGSPTRRSAPTTTARSSTTSAPSAA